MALIARRLLDKTAQRMAALGVTLTADDAAVRELAARGLDPAYGARPLRRLIRSEVEDSLAEQLLTGALRRGDTAELTLENGALRVAKREETALAALGAPGGESAEV